MQGSAQQAQTALLRHSRQSRRSDEHPSFEKVFPGRAAYSLDAGGYRLLFHMGNTGKENPGSPPPIEQWLTMQIEGIPNDMPVVLFTHYPYGKGVEYGVQGRKQVIKALKSKKLLAVLSGHFHGDTTVVEDGVLLKTIPCLTSTRDNHDETTTKGAFIYVLDGNSVSAKFVQMPGSQ